MDRKPEVSVRQRQKATVKRRRWVRAVFLLSIVVTAGTAAALTKAAITKSTECPIPEHTHTAQCYAQASSAEAAQLLCSKEALGIHTHDEACYDAGGNLACGYADYVVHEHDAACYDSAGDLLCTLPELREHLHDDSCYEVTESGRTLRCAMPEIVLHTHTPYTPGDSSSCFDVNGSCICGKPQVTAHQHSEACFRSGTQAAALTCTQQEHTHSALCQGETRLSAKQQLQVERLNNDIAQLPTQEQATAQLDTLRQAADISGWESCLAGLQSQYSAVQQEYAVCSEREKALVTGFTDAQALAALWDEDQLVCTDPSHAHTAWCYRVWQLTAGEQTRVDSVVSAIDALPSAQAVDETLAHLSRKDDAQAYILDVLAQANAAKNSYDRLSALQKQSVANADRLQSRLSSIQARAAASGAIGDRLDGDYAYISQLTIFDSTDGTGPFDADNSPGNDADANNGIVRSFDSLSYTLYIHSSVRDDSPFTYYREGTLCFEMVLPVSEEEAIFEPDSMTWLNAKPHATYQITEGTYHGRPAQILRGSFLWQPSGDNETAIGESYITLDVYLRVLAMTQGQRLQPLFTFWLDGNQIPADGCVTESSDTCDVHGQDHATATAPAVTVSSAPRFNLVMTSGFQQVLGTFDFSTGNAQAFNKDAGKVYGRVTNYGLALQIYGKTEECGLRGCELPNGSDITFDLEISSVYQYADTSGTHTVDAADSGFAPLVWCFGQNQVSGKQDDRTVANSYAGGKTFNAPYNKADADNPADLFRSCYDGGSWSATLDPDGKTMHVTISGYRINLNQIPYTAAAAAADDYRYYNPYTVGGCWDIQKACFSAGELWIVQPFNDADGVSVANKYKPGSFTLRVGDQNLEIPGYTNSTLPAGSQMVTDDDEVSTSLALQLPGTFSYDLAYQAPGNPVWNTPLAYGCWENGKDWVVAGGQARIFDFIRQTNCEGDARGVAYDQLVKFDSDFVEPTYALDYYSTLMHGMTFHAGYGVVAKSPTTGWDHHGKQPDEEGYDEEMIAATADDLIFFSSMQEVKAKGYKCVAVLFELRGVCNSSTLNTNAFIRVDVTTNPELTGYVFMITHSASVWSKADVRNAAAEYVEKEPGEVTDDDFFAYATEAFPSRLGENVGKQIRYQGNYPTYPNNYTNRGLNGSDEQDNAGFRNYKKSVYDETGWVDGSSGTQYGDSCILMNYTLSVEKSVTQVTHSGVRKTTYSIDDAQRYADFQLIGSSDIGVKNQTDSTASWLKTTVYIEDTLPKGLSYVEGSSSYGGTYQQTAEGKRGSVAGGEPITPEVTHNADGTTTLRYTIKNVALNLNQKTTLPSIFYSCLIGDPNDPANDVTHTQKLVNTAKIWSTEDSFRPFAAENGNLTDYEINVSKLKQGNISKLSDQVYVDVGEDMGFTIAICNNGEVSRAVAALDIIPFHDVNGTSFHQDGCVSQVTEISLRRNTAGVDLSTFRVYYTFRADVRSKTSSDYRDMTQAELLADGWTVLDVNADGTASIPERFEPSAILILGSLSEAQTLGVHMTIHLTDDVPGDVVVNQLYESGDKDAGLLKAQATSYVVSRTLSGLAWMDRDLNGIQDDGDASRISGLKVTLMKLKDGADPGAEESYAPYLIPGTDIPLSVETGQRIDARTGVISEYDVGCYEFAYLPAGIYAVKFENGSGGVDLAPLITTVFQNAMDTAIDSDGVGIYDDQKQLLRSIILNLSMPEASQINSTLYESKHNDSGFAERSYELPDAGGIGVNAFVYAGAGLILLAAALLLLRRKLSR